MHIWVDADACPGAVKEILFRAAARKGVPLTLVANQPLRVPPSPLITSVRVEAGFDVADNYIVQNAAAGDIVVTADIPLAAELVAAGVHAINPRGEAYTPENVRERLATRDLMETLRGSGMVQGGPSAYGPREKQAFANALDRLLSRAAR